MSQFGSIPSTNREKNSQKSISSSPSPILQITTKHWMFQVHRWIRHNQSATKLRSQNILIFVITISSIPQCSSCLLNKRVSHALLNIPISISSEQKTKKNVEEERDKRSLAQVVWAFKQQTYWHISHTVGRLVRVQLSPGVVRFNKQLRLFSLYHWHLLWERQTRHLPVFSRFFASVFNFYSASNWSRVLLDRWMRWLSTRPRWRQVWWWFLLNRK